MLLRGKAWTFGRNVNTDLIFPKVWFRPTYEPGEMASHLMVGIDEDFPKKSTAGISSLAGRISAAGRAARKRRPP